jgi:diguanylate cyclase (GGDEF)-like protein
VAAALFDSEQREVIAPRDGGDGNIVRGEIDSHPKFDQALSEGLSYSGVETEGEEGDSRFEFVVPVKLAGEPYVLEVDEDADGLNTQVATLRNKTVLFTSIALFLAMGLFYFVAGRALMRRHGKARKGASRDPLTDLGNHRSFKDELGRMVEVALRRDQSMALAVVDIDDFKLVNDRFGHQRGDDVLAEFARVLGSGREEDSAFRIGGDEFALLMPRADGDTARIALERVLAAAADEPHPTSVTAGIAVMAPGGTSR